MDWVQWFCEPIVAVAATILSIYPPSSTRRSFRTATITLKKSLYISLVRSKLTYCCQVWRPSLLKDIKLLESVQCRATKWILNDYLSNYKSRLISLHLLPLMMSLEVYDITFFLKSLSSPSEAFNILDYVSFNSDRRTRSSHYSLNHKFSRTNISRHSYFLRFPRLWNSLLELNLTTHWRCPLLLIIFELTFYLLLTALTYAPFIICVRAVPVLSLLQTNYPFSELFHNHQFSHQITATSDLTISELFITTLIFHFISVYF